METAILHRLLAITDEAKRLRELQRASMFERPLLQKELSDVFQNPDEHDERIYQLACESSQVAHMSRGDLQHLWSLYSSS
tara:strand:- start:15971 stop:16210 length:240 start_codon:yes stop_codon:yes gene_type:complete